VSDSDKTALFDSHAHLLDPRIKEAESLLQGVGRVICFYEPGEDWEGFLSFLEDERVFGACGIHPHTASGAGELMGELPRMLSHEKVRALGEIGLDFYRDNSPRDIQKEVFRRQLETACRMEMPVVVHTRSAFDETMKILQEFSPGKVLIHCFSEGAPEARDAIKSGYRIAVGGVLTFPNAARLRDAVNIIPMESLLVETDAPYLAPQPVRGRVNLPSYVSYTVEEIARIKGVSFTRAAEASFLSGSEFFGL